MSIWKTMGYGVGGAFLGGIVGRLLGVSSAILDYAIAVAVAAGLIWFFTRRKKNPSNRSLQPDGHSKRRAAVSIRFGPRVSSPPAIRIDARLRRRVQRRCPCRGRMNHQRKHIARTCPAQGMTCRLELAVTDLDRGWRQPLLQKFCADDSWHFTWLSTAHFSRRRPKK